MKLYKYRSLPDADEEELQRLKTILQRGTFWCARPDTLNDPEEFSWTCDYSISDKTIDLLVEVMIRALGRSRKVARQRVAAAIQRGRLNVLAQPVIATMIQKCRDEIGLVCFGTSAVNETLWQRYAGDGAGVCVEVDVPDTLLGNQLHAVQYWANKTIHIDKLLNAFLDSAHVREVYTLALLSKPSLWSVEQEVRFVSKRQLVSVRIDGSQITRLWIGNSISIATKRAIDRIVQALPYALTVVPHAN